MIEEDLKNSSLFKNQLIAKDSTTPQKNLLLTYVDKYSKPNLYPIL